MYWWNFPWKSFKKAPGEHITVNQSAELQEQLHLDIDSDCNYNDCNDIAGEAAVVGGLRVVYNCTIVSKFEST